MAHMTPISPVKTSAVTSVKKSSPFSTAPVYQRRELIGMGMRLPFSSNLEAA